MEQKTGIDCLRHLSRDAPRTARRNVWIDGMPTMQYVSDLNTLPGTATEYNGP